MVRRQRHAWPAQIQGLKVDLVDFDPVSPSGRSTSIDRGQVDKHFSWHKRRSQA
jgi:hypothetical protein